MIFKNINICNNIPRPEIPHAREDALSLWCAALPPDYFITPPFCQTSQCFPPSCAPLNTNKQLLPMEMYLFPLTTHRAQQWKKKMSDWTKEKSWKFVLLVFLYNNREFHIPKQYSENGERLWESDIGPFHSFTPQLFEGMIVKHANDWLCAFHHP